MMELIQPVIHTALIGTDKRQLKKEDVAADIGEAFDCIENSEADKEEQFLQLAAVLYNYQRSGTLPLHKEDAVISKAPDEVKSYGGVPAHTTLKDILSEDSPALAGYWLQACAYSNVIVQPEFLPLLFNMGIRHNVLQPLIVTCTGKRGEWLSTFNADWQFTIKESGEELWQNGTAEQRRQVLQQMRRHDPAKARGWLQQVWAQENANMKADLLQQLSVNIGDDDREWLEDVMTEKSIKVKDAALELLKTIPASRIVQQYWQLLQQSVRVKKEKEVLGIGSKISLELRLPAGMDESIFKSGIEKLSNRKDFTDEEFIICQLIQYVPPRNWQAHLSSTPEEIISLFKKHKGGKKFLQAFAHAIHRFKAVTWAIAMMEQSDEFYTIVAALLPHAQWEVYSRQHFDQYPGEIITQALQRKEEWSEELAASVLKHAARHPYNYNRAFFNLHIQHIPVGSMAALEACTPPEEHLKNLWNNTSAHITKLLTLKLQTLIAFQS